jgi:hypothetical protein
MISTISIMLSVIGACLSGWAVFSGYASYNAGDFAGLFIYFLWLIFGLNILSAGISGKESSESLGKKILGMGIGVLAIAFMLSYASAGAETAKQNMTDAMKGIITESYAQNIREQIDYSNLPETREGLAKGCSVLNNSNDEESFTTMDICDELTMEENNNLNVSEITEKALQRKAKETADRHVDEELAKSGEFGKAFDMLNKGKQYFIFLGMIGIIIFAAGSLLVYNGKREERWYDIVISICISSAVVCAVNTVLFKLTDLFITKMLMTGKVMDNAILREFMPNMTDNSGMIQEASRKMIIKIGEIMHSWLGAALDIIFIVGLVLTAAFVITAIVCYIIKRKSKKNPSSDKSQEP